MKKFTDQELREAVAQKNAWLERIGPEMSQGFLLFIEAMSLPPLILSVIGDKVEFSKEEKDKIGGAFDAIADALNSHSERVNGFSMGIGDAVKKAGIE